MRLLEFVLVCGLLSSPALAAPAQVRGTWLSTTGPDHIASGANTENVMNSVRNIGLNTVYIEAWKNGYSNFPSQVLADRIGFDRRPDLGSRDLMQETVVNAHRKNLIHAAWFEYGFSSQFIGSTGTPNNPLSQYMLNQTSIIDGQTVQGWLLRDQAGNFGNSSNGFAWMNPAVPEVRQFLIDLAVEAVQNYDLDIIQFDDRLAWPREFGWDATTAALYKVETGRNLPSSVNDSNFRLWRQQKVTQFASEMYTALKAADPDIFVSVSPSVTGFSDTNYNAVWSDWAEQGLFDEFVPQIYRDNYASFQTSLPANVNVMASAGRLDDLVIGVRVDGGGSPTPINDVRQMLTLSSTTAGGQLDGTSLWYSQGVLANQSSLADYFDPSASGQSPHPEFGLDYRPSPEVALSLGGGRWQATVAEAGDYQVAAKINNRWTQFDLVFLNAGPHQWTISGASQVELLVSRRLQAERPGDFNLDGRWDVMDADTLVAGIADGEFEVLFDLDGNGLLNGADLTRWLLLAGEQHLGPGLSYLRGDADLDGAVDVSDFNVWNQARFSATARWSQGDWDGNGVVDASDFNLWNANKFRAVLPAVVPEPTLWRWGWFWSGLCLLRTRPGYWQQQAMEI